MDVRCEKCHTEYELEESKVTEAGVTVKCTSCGNLFKIKRRSAAPPPRPPEVPADAGVMWVIRSPGGEHRRFRELTTLQQWIVERKVTRECEISRTGDAWKRLGDIAELSAFFAIVDQAQGAAKPIDRKSTQPMAQPTVPPARPPQISSSPLPPVQAAAEPRMLLATDRTEPRLDAAVDFGGEMDADPPPAESARPPVVLNDKPLELAQTAHLPGRAAAPPPVRAAAPQPRPSWAGAAVAAPADLDDRDPGDSMPPEGEPAWAKGSVAKGMARNKPSGPSPAFELPGLPIADPGGGGSAFGDSYELDALAARRPSRAWMFISGLVLAAGAVGGYFILRGRGGPTASAEPTPIPAPVVQPVPPPVAAATPDAGAAAPGAGVDRAEQAYRDALVKLGEDTDESFAAAEKLLGDARVADPVKDARAAAALALVNLTAAQYLLDDAALATDPRVAEQARAESGRRVQRAEKLVKEAEGKAPQAPETLVASASYARMTKKSAADIDKILAPVGETADSLYVRGMTRWRDGKGADAESLLESAVATRAKEGGQHLPALYRLAVLSLAAGKKDEAKNHIETILAAQSGHARARALAGKLAEPSPPVAAVPADKPADKPPADKPADKPPADKPAVDKPGDKPGAELGSGPISASAYGGLVQKGDKLAENGDCASAMKHYERALDARPGGVEALTGLGYCHLDRKDYGRAISNFRAALGISSRYTEALIGIAEAYRFQGMNQEAVGYYKKYLDQAPNGSKAAMAKRYVEALGGPAPAPTPPPVAPPDKPSTDPTPPPVDQLPDKPGAERPVENKPADTTPPPVDSLPQRSTDKAPEEAKPEPAPEPPPPERSSDPAAPDSPRQ